MAPSARRSSRLRAALFSIALTLAVGAGSVTRAIPPDPCAPGPVGAMFTAFIPAVDQRLNRQQQNGLGGLVSQCQLRLFWAFDTFCFSEDDTFLAAVNLLSFLQPQSLPDAWSHYALVEDLESFELTAVELVSSPDGGAPSSEWLDVEVTPVHAGRRADTGPLVYQHHGVFLHLPPGDYALIARSSYPGDAADPPWPGCDVLGNCVWDPVFVRVFSREDAAALGPSPDFGTVACPGE
ncbi:MAG: hypothetical protein IT385_25045 [Deltaproteobacteria bacterium]|nr:hypothetical protein [Deltaproteobacteria bacterium]